jgi:hypothetical protein
MRHNTPPRLAAGLLMLGLSSTTVSHSQSIEPFAGPIVIKAGRLFDGTSDTAFFGRSLVMLGEQVVARSRRVAPPPPR